MVVKTVTTDCDLHSGERYRPGVHPGWASLLDPGAISRGDARLPAVRRQGGQPKVGVSMAHRSAQGALQKGASIAKIVIVHDVEDVGNWLKNKAERADAIAKMGATDVVDHVAHDGSKTVAITANSGDVDAVVAATASPGPELLDTMQRHGVVPPVKVFVEK